MFAKRIGVIGLGLLGGALCKALKEYNPEVYIVGYGRRPEVLEKARRDRTIDEIQFVDGLEFAELDLIIVATPAAISIEIIKKILDSNTLGRALIIDVGSVKEAIVDSITGHPQSYRFIGCHPMAGAETMGYESSYSALYHGASIVITPHKENNKADIDKIIGFWESVGAQPVLSEPGSHDFFVAVTSHIPHIIASLLVQQLMVHNEKPGAMDFFPFIGNGFMDTTRIAAGSPEMWRDILLLNQEKIIDELELFSEKLTELTDILNIQNMKEKSDKLFVFFESIKDYRDKLAKRKE